MIREALLERLGRATRLAVLEDGRLAEWQVYREDDARVTGSVFLGRIQRIVPSLRAAFMDIGLSKNALLPLEGPPERWPKGGDCVVVQAHKEADEGKGARVTRGISLAGRSLAFLAGEDTVGVSKKINQSEDRDALLRLAKTVSRHGHGLILRTNAQPLAAEAATEAGFARTVAMLQTEYDRLAALWANVSERAKALQPPVLLHADESVAVRVARDLTCPQLESVWANDAALAQDVMAAMQAYAPEYQDRVFLHDPASSAMPLFEAAGVDKQADALHHRRVWLPCGGCLLIEPGETLTAVDVNSGKFAERVLEAEGVLRVNLEAAGEAARQLRLRDLGGVILIDFINMRSAEHRAKVRKRFIEATAGDRGAPGVPEWTATGLLELTRKKVGAPVHRMIEDACPCCGGTGRVPSMDTVAWRIARKARETARALPTGGKVRVLAHPDALAWLPNEAQDDFPNPFLEGAPVERGLLKSRHPWDYDVRGIDPNPANTAAAVSSDG